MANKEVSLFDKCLVVLLVVAVAGIVLVLANSLMAKPPDGGKAPAESACPPPTVSKGGVCTLTKDTVLTSTIELPSNAILDCKGKKLTPSVAGVIDNPATSTNEFNASTPEVAILIHNSSGVTVQNCNIQGFDFGILSVDVKTPPLQNKILQNNITTRTTTIMLMGADNHTVQGNTLTFTSNTGHGMFIGSDSDNNLIKQNTIASVGKKAVGYVSFLPGRISVFSELVFEQDSGIIVIGGFPLTNIAVEGRLFQLAGPDKPTTTDNNIIEGNTITYAGIHTARYPGPVSTSLEPGAIYADVRTTGLIVRGNTINGAEGIDHGFAGYGHGSKLIISTPGTCTLNTSRFCLFHSDCSIPSVDNETDYGICRGVGSVENDGRVFNTIVEDNLIRGPFIFTHEPYDEAIIIDQNVNATVRNNTIIGTADAPITHGIRVGYSSLESSTIEHNTISGATNALFLEAGREVEYPTGTPQGVKEYPTGSDAAKSFGSKISRNDFTNYVTAVLTDNVYNLPSQLSVDDQGNICGPGSTNCRGNYWGINSCPGFDPNLVIKANGHPQTNVVDSHPYSVPVANTPDASLPTAPPGKCS
jgi:hypothetical protein